jgi:hypothetical protein
MRGLDPRIHPEKFLALSMDCPAIWREDPLRAFARQ